MDINSHQKVPLHKNIVSFALLINYFKNSYKIFLICGLIGLSIGGVAYLNKPKLYEASFILKLPSANGVSPFGEVQRHIIKPVPTALDLKKTLLQPANISSDLLKICGFGDTNDDRKKMVNSITSNVVNYDTGLQVVIRLPGVGLTKQCATGLSEELMLFSNKEKDRYVNYANKTSSLNNRMLVDESARLESTIRISDQVVYPRLDHFLMGSFILGLLFWGFVDWARFLWSRAR